MGALHFKHLCCQHVAAKVQLCSLNSKGSHKKKCLECCRHLDVFSTESHLTTKSGTGTF